MAEKIWKIVRVILSGLLLLAVLLPATFYIVLSTPFAQNYVREIATDELSRLLGVGVEIEKVTIHPFNRLSIEGVSIASPVPDERHIAEISEISAGVELFHFLKSGEIIIDYALLEEARIAINRPTPGAPLNISPIIDRLRSDKTDRPPTKFDLRINTVVLHNASLSYDVLSEPESDSLHVFDKNHIEISSLNLNAYLPKLSNDCYRGEIDHLSFRERCGFEVKKLTAKATFSTEGAELDDFSLALDGTQIALAPIVLEYDSFDNIIASLKTSELQVSTLGANRLYLPDFAPFIPRLEQFGQNISLAFDITGNTRHIDIRNLTLAETDQNLFKAFINASVSNLDMPADSIAYNIRNIDIAVAPGILKEISPSALSANTLRLIGTTPLLHINAVAEGQGGNGSARLSAKGAAGSIDFDGRYAMSPKECRGTAQGKLTFSDIAAGLLSGNQKLGMANGSVDARAIFSPNNLAGSVRIDIDGIEYNNHTYRDITAEITATDKSNISYSLSSADPAAAVDMEGEYTATANGTRHLLSQINIENIDFTMAGITSDENTTLKGHADIDLCGQNIDDMAGSVKLSGFVLDRNGLEPLTLNSFEIERHHDSPTPGITISSDYLNGEIEGLTTFSTLPAEAMQIAGSVMPSLLHYSDREYSGKNVFSFDLRLDNLNRIADALGIKITPVYPTTVSGHFDSAAGTANIDIDSPYLRNGNKYITNTSINAQINAPEGNARIYITSEIPTKKGLMGIGCVVKASDNVADTRIDWTIERDIPINGIIGFTTEVRRDDSDKVEASVSFNPGTINFGDDVWKINPATIDYSGSEITVDGFALAAGRQSISINGTVGNAESDSLNIDLRGINMLPIFETLEIDKALISGHADGRLVAKQVLTPTPVVYSEFLHVDSIGYNRCTLGNADVNAWWDNDKKAFTLDADVIEPGGLHSHIFGDIYPLTESLDITFDANHVRVGFMKPFMEAFTSDITGYVSGHARLFGTFKEIDLEGDIFADDLKLKIDFTNTWYSATDSIHVIPGRIDIKDITIRDVNGHTALLNGFVAHTYFKQPVFRFEVTEARDFLSFNGTPRQNPDWYGTIYGNGDATISGRPGVVDIGVKMATAPGSMFTFVLSDRLDADDYTFINFRDITPAPPSDSITAADDTPAEFIEYLRHGNAHNTDNPSAYNMDISVDITPDAQMILVMDPIGGDRIKATGNGNMRMTYNSIDNSIFMQGKYTVDQGSYNFTLQDIIIKDFTIDGGSTIQFSGDPYRPEANITAYYALNANLTDLDESFAQDKDISRTNVPVHAIMKVSGDIRQPSIDFDLGFPTLTQDTYRKVRSIVSTREMMNRQIIYLLALNRFYTPDYMASTTKGNELFSVASSTLSSQLGNMLGKLSENWSIAPNLRSDRGDFSDVEVDVALSSRLLNNRLLFNGNFGYRDNTLNNNQFIGDFDIEYLLNRRGSLRLKAYNRYNDRNYYVRSAQTTQGVGIMFKRDFDNFFSFLRRKKNKKEQPESETDNKEQQ